MIEFPSSDESFARLHSAGWTVGDTAVLSSVGLRWIVSGTNGENAIEARSGSQNEAWWWACEQARAVGMLRDASPNEGR